ncbi:ABC transporter permease [Streptomyces sp. NPDC048442]|uniref:ABC transporter permease n=1 Tax=Streptomyces sp. NPDC048442 TaxID=3154823 RepID=UPI0034187A6F
MTAPLTASPPTATAGTAVPDARPRFLDLLAAEWTKLWSLRSMRWAFPVTALIVIGISANGALADYRNWPNYSEDIREQFVPTWAIRDAFPITSATVLMMIIATLGALTVTNEYSSGMIRTTLAAVPARRSMLAAKMMVLAGVTTAFGVLVVAVSFTLSQAILSGRGVSVGLGDPEVLRSLASSAVLAPVSALIGLGVGVLLRHGAATVAVTALALILLPSFLTENEQWTAALKYAMPLNAWTNLCAIAPSWMQPAPYVPSLTHSWIVLAVWPVVAVALALGLVHRRDL